MKNSSNIKTTKTNVHSNRFQVGRVLQVIVALVFLIFLGRTLYISISKTVAGENLSTRTAALYKRNQVLKATRGTIYDRNGFTIAEDSHVYTVYAILDHSSINYKNKPEYVVDKDKTAEKLATVLPLSKEQILKYLNPKTKAFQVQFGSGGSNLTIEQKKKIEQMKLPGIKFIEAPSRLYVNGVFASHIVGLAQPIYNKKTKSTDLVGTMGIEAYYDKYLAGKDGFKESSVDASEYQLPNGTNAYRAAKNGDDIYLTLDSQLQNYMENLLTRVQNKYQSKALTAVVEDLRTGKVLAASQRPTFDSQTKKGLTSSYTDLLTQSTFEPGSVFKILSFAAAINSGHYNPNELYKSGSLTVNGSTIHDWNVTGWGSIPLYEAFPRSSNVGLSILEQKMGATTWRSYLNKFGITKKKGITLPGEQAGMIAFKSKLDQAVTSFGQGVNVNVWQMMQAYSILANKGQMVKPQLVEKIVSPSGKVIQNYKVQKVGKKVVSESTVKTVLQGMQDVVNKQYGTGTTYKIAGKSIAVKTGTAQIAGPNGYLTGNNNYIFSVIGVTPANNPHYAIYLTMKQPQKMTDPAETILASIFKPMMNRLILSSSVTKKASASKEEVPNVIGKSITNAKNDIEKVALSVEVLGSGDVVTQQTPATGQKLTAGSKVFVLTSGKIAAANFTNWTVEEVKQYAALAGISVKVSGSEDGKVKSQNIKVGTLLKSGQEIIIKTK
ncbi:penicillin-binding transpeptidase domain-containing protein [Lactobacillus jensenii]|uniref:peptidoglycan D,D-transpeptidase FtsI family protein n=1 Tax=Lactobacillus jensenii TaxID=109790 RepID=UPI00118EAF2D|nr:penicillin-binding protein 2 [Lactobacillus jensenii]MDK7161106.1 penicillin-binding transpeptidase domain-containing protein [Lactobacillus jensenii]TVV13404.1 penicillin-binding protein [Lactobacillus jensenii]TVV15046.1 penicillin-binding protein [Lactobacillus jensenii]